MKAVLQTQLKTNKQNIDEALVDYLESVDIQRYSRHGREAWENAKEFSLRPGKRIRGGLLLIAYEMFGGKNREQALKAAVAIELVQNYLLMIDDVMDRSEIRRGKPTIQKLYYKRLKPVSNDDHEHLGDMLAINIGLILQHLASEIMSSLKLDANDVLKANVLFHQNIRNTGYGQVDDLFSGIEHTSEEDILLYHELKSSYYTFINPMQVGAALAGADDAEIEGVKSFGAPAGIAFQLQDDILGLFGNLDITGKSHLDDLKEGKYTLIIQQAFERADKQGAVTIVEALGNHSVTDEQAQVVMQIIEECGAREYAESVARDFASQAKKAITKNNWPKQQGQLLNELMDYIVERLN